MRKMKKLCAAISMLLTVAVAAPMLSGSISADAAKKPKLSKTKLNIQVGSSKTLKVKNYKKKVTWKTSKKSVAKLSNIKKTSVKVNGKKKGSAKVTATMKVSGKKLVLKCTVIVNPKTPDPVKTPEPSVTVTTAPTATPAVTPDPNATPTPTPEFDYDNYAGCLWKEPGAYIKDLFKDYFVCGISTDKGSLRYGETASMVRHHFGSVTMGNENKMESIVSVDATEQYPDGYSTANVDNYYNGDGRVILNYTTLEEVLSYCKANGIKLRYHAFVWHAQVREYFFLQDYNWEDYTLDDYREKGWPVENYHKLADPETMKKRLESYIDQVIEYIYSHGYGDVVYAYDVINEATNGDTGNTYNYYVNENATTVDDLLSTSGSANKFQTNGGVRTEGGQRVDANSSVDDIESMLKREGRGVNSSDSYWYGTMGPDYLYLSFLYAHNAVEKYYEQYKDKFNYTTKPSLIYNDYNTRENDHIALAKYINLACNMKNGTTGVKYCNGIGLQSHSIGEGTQETMIKNIANAGLEVQITELDEGADGDAQAVKLKKLYTIYMKYSKNGEYGRAQGDDYIGVTSVTQWGISDGDGSWGQGKIKYMFMPYEGDDENLKLQPKPAFYGVLQAGGAKCGSKVY